MLRTLKFWGVFFWILKLWQIIEETPKITVDVALEVLAAAAAVTVVAVVVQ
jgi:hypothetical protein